MVNIFNNIMFSYREYLYSFKRFSLWRFDFRFVGFLFEIILRLSFTPYNAMRINIDKTKGYYT
jgi:hypothetical protein